MSSSLPQNIILGLHGRRKSGKDTVYGYLWKHFPEHRIIRMSIGDEIKNELAVLTGGNIDTINLNKDNIILRKVLQFIGGDVYGEETAPYWMEKIATKITDYFSKHPTTKNLLCITDIRYKCQYDTVKLFGGLELLVERKKMDERSLHYIEEERNNLIDKHSSEINTDILPYDFRICNHAGLRRLEYEVANVCGFIKERLKVNGHERISSKI